jgi:hypothetical protein
MPKARGFDKLSMRVDRRQPGFFGEFNAATDPLTQINEGGAQSGIKY